jgi:NitT/TauT family transport system substrate-binding protein
MSISRAQFLAQSTAAAIFANGSNAGAQTPQKIRLGVGVADAYGSPFFATDAGFFDRAGLSVEMGILTSGGAIAQGIVGNAFDAGFIDLMTLSLATAAGVPIVTFAGGGLYTSEAPTSFLVARKDSTLRIAPDLEGQTIAMIALGSAPELATREWLRQNGANVEKVRIVELSLAEMMPAMTRGAVQAMFLAEPFYTQVRDDVRVISKPYDSLARSFYISTLAAKRDWIDQNRSSARKLATAIHEANRWANEHQEETAVILSRYSKMDASKIRASTRVRFATALDVRQMQPILDAAYRYRKIDRQLKAADLIVRV